MGEVHLYDVDSHWLLWAVDMTWKILVGQARCQSKGQSAVAILKPRCARSLEFSWRKCERLDLFYFLPMFLINGFDLNLFASLDSLPNDENKLERSSCAHGRRRTEHSQHAVSVLSLQLFYRFTVNAS